MTGKSGRIRVLHWGIRVSLAWLVTAGLGTAGTTAQSRPAATPQATTRPATQPAPRKVLLPQTPGHHRLFFESKREDRPLKLAYAVYVPRTYRGENRPRPMVVFLMGAGEVGNNHDGIYVHGPAAEIKRNRELEAWADFIVLSPQCPAGLRWDSPGMARVVLDLIELSRASWRVDRERVYLTGLSMGGLGTWRVAMEADGAFAAVAPICAVAYEPNKIAESLRRTSVWIIGGGADGDYTTGARKMAEALTAAKIDVIHTEVPGGGHGVWGSYYSSRKFYECLLLHSRGGKAPPRRPAPKELLAIAYTPPASMDARLAEPFRRFLPYWQLLNCGDNMGPGPREEFRGRRNVFATHPLDQGTPCRMMTTVKVPAAGKTTLELTVGHHDDGDWELVVLGDGKELARKTVGKHTAVNGWLDASVDLSASAGRETRIELLNSPTGWHNEAGYWAKVKVVTAK